MDIEGAFDSLDHSFLISVFESIIESIKILLYKQESCVLNGDFTTKYFNLEKVPRQGDPISAYLLILTCISINSYVFSLYGICR